MSPPDGPPNIAARSILIVDDEAELRALLVAYLGPRGLVVHEAVDSPTMWAQLATHPIGLVILDVGIGAESGLDLLGELRARGNAVPVMMLTGRDGLDDCLAGLGRGADDYVTKPFQPRELLARINAVLRRVPVAGQRPTIVSGSAPPPPIRLGRCLLDAASGRLTAVEGGAEVPLTSMELELLRTMLRHPGIPLSRDQLSELAHGVEAKAGARGIEALVMRLRRRLETDPAEPLVLRTVRGQGYLLAPGEP